MFIVRCNYAENVEASLEAGRLYVADVEAEFLRVTDESGESYLYARSRFDAVAGVGDRVAAGRGEDRDVGIIHEITEGGDVRIGWDSGVETVLAVDALAKLEATR